MRRRTLILFIIVSIIAAPAAAEISRQPVCVDRNCCCQAMDRHHGSRSMMDPAACECASTQAAPCHIEADPYGSQPAVIVSTDRGADPGRALLFTALQDDGRVSLTTPLMTAPIVKSSSGSPPAYLIACVFII